MTFEVREGDCVELMRATPEGRAYLLGLVFSKKELEYIRWEIGYHHRFDAEHQLDPLDPRPSFDAWAKLRDALREEG